MAREYTPPRAVLPHTRNCGNCNAYRATTGTLGGTCNANAPEPFLDRDSTYTYSYNVIWPAVHEDDYCREHEPVAPTPAPGGTP